ncbi:MAG: diacylglycerol kinase [Jatrophihabitans sp.]|uniref:diacylglycerol kinase n=1 Tax=Jatrophihabitans sp. TaxID=1932789 RepID=UPI003F7D08AA
MTRIALLTNPAAGHGRAVAAAERAAAHLTARGATVDRVRGDTAEQSAQLARDAVAGGADALVVVGGDGMIHLALPAVVGTDVPLGVIPAGTGNDQARHHGWPRDSVEAAADVVLAGHTRRIDVGVATTADGRRTYFGSVLACGLDSLISDRVNRMTWPHGRARYHLAMAIEFARLKPLPMTVTLADGTVISQDNLLVAVGNTSMYGGGLRMCPDADATDGLLDVTIAAAAPRRQVVAQLPRTYRGTHVQHPRTQTFRTPSLRIEAGGMNAYADGDFVGPTPVDVTVEPAALALLVHDR